MVCQKLNRAMNIQAEQAEMEVDRKRNAANFYGRGYDLVKLKGELKIANRLAKGIEVEINKELSGEVLEKTGNPTDVQTARGLKQVNTKHQLTWLAKLAPGEEQKCSYTYQLYISP
jgi:predicted transcriptional regulator